jgi:hypothetical protein
MSVNMRATTQRVTLFAAALGLAITGSACADAKSSPDVAETRMECFYRSPEARQRAIESGEHEQRGCDN